MHKLAIINSEYIKRHDYFLLFETSLFDRENFTSYIFLNPVKVLKIKRYQDVEEAFEKIEKYSKRYYLAGYFSYELGYYFEKDFFRPKGSPRYPLIHLCIFDKAVSFNHKIGKTNIAMPSLFAQSRKEENFRIKDLKFNFTKPQYLKKISRIKEYIREGQTYQVNFTAKFRFNFSGSPFALYNDLKNRQSVPYSAFCKFKDEWVVSLSPELYFKREGLKVYSRPMKGTIPRGRDIREDSKRVRKLKNSRKDRAENLMIVDLIRNDLGRISEVDSVKAADLFKVEKYNTLFQMTSAVKSILRKNSTYFEVFKSIFPGGSVTGAPKIRTMQIIQELERGPRNIYCGALGIIFPRHKAIFNLPIRTVSLIKNKGEMGVGSGIVSDSRPSSEYAECLLKARFLTDRYKPFQLIETILWDAKFRFLNAHLKRMRLSAAYFGFYFPFAKIISQLNNTADKFTPFRDKSLTGFTRGFNYKVRLLLDKEGNLQIGSAKTSETHPPQNKYIAVSKYRTDPENIFLYHKTTRRDLYDAEYRHYRSKGYHEVIFLNKRGEVTEGTVSNVVIKMHKKYYTPPVSSGLLPGVFRGYLIKKRNIEERILFLEDLIKADKVFICNSVRGLNEVRLR